VILAHAREGLCIDEGLNRGSPRFIGCVPSRTHLPDGDQGESNRGEGSDDCRYGLPLGWLTEDDQPRPSVELESRLRREIADLCDALAMTPRSRAKLGLDLVQGRKSLIEQMAEETEQRGEDR
jgi:hypothetical protein